MMIIIPDAAVVYACPPSSVLPPRGCFFLAISTTLSALNNDKGTPLRQAFKSARLTLDDAAAKARERTTDRQKEVAERMQKMIKERKARFEEMDKSGGGRKTGRRVEVYGCLFSVRDHCCCCRCVAGPGWVRSPTRVGRERKNTLVLGGTVVLHFMCHSLVRTRFSYIEVCCLSCLKTSALVC